MPKTRNPGVARSPVKSDSKGYRRVGNLNDMTNEPQLWANQLPNAKSALDFWTTFLDFRMGADDRPLDTTASARLLTLVRAVSWVESQHGTGSGNQPARDPMQCGNPSDSWWMELVGPVGTGDRLIGGPNAGNYFAGDLANAVESNASFPASARLSTLTNRVSGHDDVNFSAIMSYCWAVPILVHKMNTGAGDKTYECGDLSQQRAVAGAVAYNGGGDPAYGQKITDALNTIGWPSFLEKTDLFTVRDVGGTVQDLLEQTVRTISSAHATPGDGKERLFFPNGIELIDLHIKVGAVDIEVKVAGPKPLSEGTGHSS